MDTEQTFPRGAVFPSWWANAAGRFLSVAAFQVRIEQATSTSIRVPAGSGPDAAALGIAGKWRYNEASALRSHPGGAAGTYPIFVTAKANDISNSPATGTDNTDRSFALSIVPPGSTPTIVAGSIDIFRKIGSCVWDGAKIVSIASLLVDIAGNGGELAADRVGEIAYFAITPTSKWAACDGTAVTTAKGWPVLRDKLIAASFPFGQDASGNPLLPDDRGRVRVGSGSGTGLTSRAIGTKWGVEAVLLTAAQSGLPDHPHDMEAYNLGGAPPALVSANGRIAMLGADANPNAGLKGFATNGNNQFQYAYGVGGIPGGARNASAGHDNLPPSIAFPSFIRVVA